MDGIGLARALVRWGCDVYLQPVWIDVPFPPDLLPLLAKPLDAPFDLTINHWSPDQLEIGEQARRCTRLAVAWTMWEFAPAPGPVEMNGKIVQPKSGLVPQCKNRGSLRSRLKWYDVVLGYDPVSVASLAPYVPKGVALGQLQGGFEAGEWAPMQRDWTGGRFGFAMHGALNNRKCPWTVVQAFNELKHEHPDEFEAASLALHTMIPGLFTELNDVLGSKKVRVWMGPWDVATLKSFYNAAHCLVYPSRGEGKNLPALEFMATGGTVIATNFGGHKVWLRDDIAYPLDYTLMPTFPSRPDGAHDARVSVQHLKDVMWHVFTHRPEARQKGELAAKIIPSQCDWSVVVETLWDRLRDMVPGPGEVVRNMALECRRSGSWGE